MNFLKKIDVTRVLSIGGLVLSVVATIMTNSANSKELDAKVEEKVSKALAK